jgi:VanZ family protein
MKNFVQYQLPLIIWAVIIFWLSSLSSLPHIETPIIAEDKLAHLSVYFLFCWFSHRALFFQISSTVLKRWALVGAFLLTCLYGYFDEVHQLFVPNRSYDYYDMLADAIGAILYVILITVLNRRKRRQPGTG